MAATLERLLVEPTACILIGMSSGQKLGILISRSLLAILICATFPSNACGQYVQQGAKLDGMSAVGNASQGNSVALSSDGNTAIIGGVSDSGGVGAAWVFARSSGGLWTQQGQKLVGTGFVGNASQGNSVALSGDGSTAIVGGPSDNGGVGAVWVFTRSGGAWTQQGSKLIGTGAIGNAGQGNSVALSSDGNTAIVGGASDSSGIGGAWVFARSGSVWDQQRPKVGRHRCGWERRTR